MGTKGSDGNLTLSQLLNLTILGPKNSKLRDFCARGRGPAKPASFVKGKFGRGPCVRIILERRPAGSINEKEKKV